jgi:NADH dehydrogenase (ubiquinone) 1 alpha subcomplex subunit 6
MRHESRRGVASGVAVCHRARAVVRTKFPFRNTFQKYIDKIYTPYGLCVRTQYLFRNLAIARAALSSHTRARDMFTRPARRVAPRAFAASTRALHASRAAHTAPMGQSEILSQPRPLQTPSRDIREAERRGRDFFRRICRAIPQVMEDYQLKEITTQDHLRRSIGELLRANMGEVARHPAEVRPGVLDQALMRAEEEYIAVVSHHFQRHHLITNFVNSACRESKDGSKAAQSSFLKDFLGGGVRELN